MDAYVYQAELYCEECADKILCTLPMGDDVRLSDDSEVQPQGPYADGGGESDSPQHCAQCGVFLENPLTQDGYAYVRECIADTRSTGHGAVVQEWVEFYDLAEES